MPSALTALSVNNTKPESLTKTKLTSLCVYPHLPSTIVFALRCPSSAALTAILWHFSKLWVTSFMISWLRFNSCGRPWNKGGSIKGNERLIRWEHFSVHTKLPISFSLVNGPDFSIMLLWEGCQSSAQRAWYLEHLAIWWLAKLCVQKVVQNVTKIITWPHFHWICHSSRLADIHH